MRNKIEEILRDFRDNQTVAMFYMCCYKMKKLCSIQNLKKE